MNQKNILFGLFFLINSYSYCQIELWGITSEGGQNNSGSIFKFNTETNTHTIVHNFNKCDGIPPIENLIRTSSGRLIGTTKIGGVNGIGTISEYFPTSNTFSILYSFDYSSGTEPNGKLIETPNRILFGVTKYGGVENSGTFFSFDLNTNQYNKLADFQSIINGKYPNGGLVLDGDFIYGTTDLGGLVNFGGIFKYQISSQALASSYFFNSDYNGYYPNNLMKTINGKFFGNTGKGGFFNDGFIFEYIPITNSIVNKISLPGNFTQNPVFGTFLEHSDGKLYGLRRSGGEGGRPVVFSYDPQTNEYLIKKDFYNLAFENYVLHTGFNVGTDGLFYGISGKTVFKYDPNLNDLQFYTVFNNYTNDRKLLGFFSNGKFLGVNNEFNKSELIEYDTQLNVFTNKTEFGKAINGSYPYTNLFKSKDGKFYGVTSSGGQNGFGTLFSIDPKTSIFQKEYEFTSQSEAPFGGLIETNLGIFLGTTFSGGNNYSGSIFEYNQEQKNSITKYSFVQPANYYPYSGLIQYNSNHFYGIANGGANNNGVIFKYDLSTNQYENKASFLSRTTGSWLYDPTLIATKNGRIFGQTGQGPNGYLGTIFEYDIGQNEIINKINFINSQDYGYGESLGLMEANNGLLYGANENGGNSNLGALFEYNPQTNIYTKKIDFTGTGNGSKPITKLLQTHDGTIYGHTSKGGSYDFGTIFRYNINTNSLTKLFEFNGYNGSAPYHELSQYINTISTVKSGDWNDSSVWEGGNVPNYKSYVTIRPNHTITIKNFPIAIKYLELNGEINFLDGGSLNLTE